jgi:hypothetical protein
MYFIKFLVFLILLSISTKIVEFLTKKNKDTNNNKLYSNLLLVFFAILTIILAYFTMINGAAIMFERYR